MLTSQLVFETKEEYDFLKNKVQEAEKHLTLSAHLHFRFFFLSGDPIQFQP